MNAELKQVISFYDEYIHNDVQDKSRRTHDPYWSSFCIKENYRQDDPNCDRGELQMSKNLIRHEYGCWFKVGEVIDS